MSEEDEHIPGLMGPEPRVLSANQLVSYNLMRARKAHGWSQQHLAQRLEAYTGRSWSNASISAAERAWQGGRWRRFDASEIVAMALIFNEPVTFFFLPPDKNHYPAKWVGMKEFKDGRPDLSSMEDGVAFLATAALVKILALKEVSPLFVRRMQELCREWLGLEWDMPEIRAIPKQTKTEPEGAGWGEVQATVNELQAKRAEEAERALSSEHREAFLQKNADEMAMRIADRLFRMGIIRHDVPPDSDSSAGEDPPL